MEIEVPFAIRHDAPIVADLARMRGVWRDRTAGEDDAQPLGIERDRSERFEHGLGAAMLEHSIVAGQEQGGVSVASDEEEQRRPERSHRLETRQGGRRRAGQQPGAKAAAADRPPSLRSRR